MEVAAIVPPRALALDRDAVAFAGALQVGGVDGDLGIVVHFPLDAPTADIQGELAGLEALDRAADHAGGGQFHGLGGTLVRRGFFSLAGLAAGAIASRGGPKGEVVHLGGFRPGRALGKQTGGVLRVQRDDRSVA